MGKLFGTDGIRGVANQHPMTPEMALQVGRAVADVFAGGKQAKIVIGRDTRISGPMIESALVAGICSMGCDALLCGVMPTPAVACMTTSMQAAAGLVVSASHNPYYDNGIKVFNGDGFKLSEGIEDRLEMIALDQKAAEQTRSIKNTGRVDTISGSEQQYRKLLLQALPPGMNFKGKTILMDCSNGATYRVAPELFKELGANVGPLFVKPDGKNINDGCGSQHPESLARKVSEVTADIGLAFDGDGDRLIAVDEKGEILTGDQLLAVLAAYLKQSDLLKNNTVVSTVMSNMGLGAALKDMNIKHVMAGVGDRYVVEEMKTHGAVLGGEDSGHTVLLDHHTTGDGMLTALKLIEVMIHMDKPLSELKQIMTVFPQVLISVDVKDKPEIDTLVDVTAEIQKVEKKLAGKGRVLVRYSGTQPQCRIMVEGPTKNECQIYSERIASTVIKAIGK